jgi:peptidoglycan hydrolase-like protein with peptidoglycan-binding domain
MEVPYMDIVRALKINSKGPDVELLAEQLSNLGYDTGSMTDQTFSGDLEKALKEFQKDFGLKEDGVASLATLQAIKNALSAVEPGSFRLEANTRSAIARLQGEIQERVTELSRLVSGSLGLDSALPVRQFTLTNNPEGRLSFKLDPGRVPVGDFSVPALRPIGGRGAVCYIDPPGICIPCSAVIIIIVIRA